MGLPQFKGAELEWGPFRCSSSTWVKGCQGHGHAAVDGCVYPWGKETDGTWSEEAFRRIQMEDLISETYKKMFVVGHP